MLHNLCQGNAHVLRWVLIKDDQLGGPVHALLCTDTTISPKEVIMRYGERWQEEFTFHFLTNLCIVLHLCGSAPLR